MLEKITNLTDAERARIRRSPDKLGYVALIDFARGPRGRRYRGSRTEAQIVEAAHERQVRSSAKRQFVGTYIIRITTVLVDPLGNVLESEVEDLKELAKR